MKTYRNYFFLAFISVSLINAQEIDYNTNKGFVAEGYDVVSYFNGKALEGIDDITYTHNGADYKFINKENLEKFKQNPEQYVPQYGGYCAWAVADKGKKVSIDPESFEIRDGKLYLFYDSIFANTLKKWKKNQPDELLKKADSNWEKIKFGDAEN